MNRVGPQLLGRLLHSHGPALVLYARQWCRAPEDVVQEAFLKLARQRRPPEHVVPWLYRVVRNGAIAWSRTAHRRRKREADVAAAEGWFTDVEESLDAQTATAALAALPLELREVIVARLWGGLTLEEIGRLSGTSSSTAHRRYESGLSMLRERLGEKCPKKGSP